MYIPILFAPPKQGGILQSSGFLDLTSLIALSQTAKAHAFDELSLILYIENEVILDHQVRTREDAIRFLELACRRFVGWLRDGWCTRDVAHYATEFGYFVMFSKMLSTATDWGEVYAILYYALRTNNTVLRNVAGAKPESLRLILNAFPESQHWQFVSMKDRHGNTVLDYTARYGRPESIQFILSIYPESERLTALCKRDEKGRTALHYVADSLPDSVRCILTQLTESHRLQVVSMQDRLPQFENMADKMTRLFRPFWSWYQDRSR